jgi:glycosyltransferase involved in cell wall biosynthesis
MKRSLPISVVIPVLNEAQNLPACLASVQWADEIVVVDSHSTDGTGAIAKRQGAQVWQFDFCPGGPRKKNWVLQSAPLRHEWVFFLDADERVPLELHAELVELFGRGPDREGYYVNRKLIFLGRWLKHGGNYPSWNLRLFRRSRGRFERLGTERLAAAGDVEVHEHVCLDGPVGWLQTPLLHEDEKDLRHFIERHNRYSTWDAAMRRELLEANTAVESIPARFFGGPVERKRWLKRWWIRLPATPLLRFVYAYILRAGFLDGRAGLIYALFKAVQEFHIAAKIYEAELRDRAVVDVAAPCTH